MKITATRFHDFSAGHRVYGHESKCAHLHGHNYRTYFTVEAELDAIGRVMDFSVIKALLCEWLEQNWDHKTLIYKLDPWLPKLKELDETIVESEFNPTAENMAMHLLQIVGPKVLQGTGVKLIKVVVEETRKCSAEAHTEDFGEI